MNILLVEDEPDVQRSLSKFLTKLGYDVACAGNGLDGLSTFHSRTFDLVITDLRIPGIDGLELMRRIKVTERSSADVIVITGHGDMETAIKALKYGAFDYLQKPINVRELAITIERSSEYRILKKNYTSLKEEFQERLDLETRESRGRVDQIREAYLEEIGLGGMYVYSDAMRQVIDLAEKYSYDRTIPVLIEGETGTGKELVARFIHFYGRDRSAAPFVAINCGAMPYELFEGELFGHERGAYTGATETGRAGKLEAANGGSIFLDEIGEMPPGLQVKLLRVLEEKKVYRLGSSKERPIDIRVISATNRNLRDEVMAKRFRTDLLYRINMGHIRIPPLRERKEDILPLALRFVNRAATSRGKRFGRFTPAVEALLISLPWPGNVRQLKNAMERLSLTGPLDSVDVGDISFVKDWDFESDAAPEVRPILGRSDFDLPGNGLDLGALNEQIIRAVLERFHGNQLRSAKYLGISRRVLQGKLRKMGVLKPDSLGRLNEIK